MWLCHHPTNDKHETQPSTHGNPQESTNDRHESHTSTHGNPQDSRTCKQAKTFSEGRGHEAISEIRGPKQRVHITNLLLHRIYALVLYLKGSEEPQLSE